MGMCNMKKKKGERKRNDVDPDFFGVNDKMQLLNCIKRRTLYDTGRCVCSVWSMISEVLCVNMGALPKRVADQINKACPKDSN